MSFSYNNIPPAQWPMCTPYPISLPDSLVNISKPLVKKKDNLSFGNVFGSNKLKELYIELSKYNHLDMDLRINIERPDQELIAKYLPYDCCVLELGGESGTTSLLINKIIKNPFNHVIIEPSSNSIPKLYKTANIYNAKYKVVHGFIGLDRNIHKKLWPECEVSNMYDLATINKLVNSKFDVLVVDCEGAFYNILNEFPDILDNIKLIIIENDGPQENVKYIRNKLKVNNFNLIHSQCHPFLNTKNDWNINNVNDYKILKNSDNIIGFHEVYYKNSEIDINKLAKMNFNRWNNALLTKDPKIVSELYISENLSFLPTMSSKHIIDIKETDEYFIKVLEKNPNGEIVVDKIDILNENNYLHSGLYNFKLEIDNKNELCECRFTFIWKKINDEWKISHHHSSILPK